MKTTISLLRMFEALDNVVVLVELTLLDRDIDPNDILPYYTSSTNVQMSAEYTLSEQVQRARRYRSETYPTSELPIKPSLKPTAIP